MKEESKSLYLAIVASILIIFGVNHFFPSQKVITNSKEEIVDTPEVADLNTNINLIQENILPAKEIAELENNITVESPNIKGSIRIKGSRFDYLSLTKYKQTLEENSDNVELLQPAKTLLPYFAEFGWLSSSSDIKVPNSETVWHVIGDKLTPETPITLTWDNQQGLKFIKTISVDENYLFNIMQTVENNTKNPVVLYPYGLISRKIDMKSQKRSVVHEGFSGVINGSLEEVKFNDLDEKESEIFETQKGWFGFSDRYWFTAIILDHNTNSSIKISRNNNDVFQTDYRGPAVTIATGSASTNTVRFYAGAKEIKLLDKYTDENQIEKFDLAVDFGWYYFLTKPFFYILTFLYSIIGNMGWAILLFAALLRLVMFPIASSSYESMSKMKKMQPKVMILQELYKNDRMRLQQETMDLYRKEKINPAAGCLPLFIQIPVFFSLYKVLNIAIEIRHAPFVGWIKDLSAPDPLTISVWSHIPLPSLLDIGIWPILMGFTMWFQQKLNPAPTNKDQARMFAMMPFIFTLMLGQFASGLVIYWTLSNILSIIQQKYIMKKHGVN